jgi:dihydrofolate reductase
MDILAIFAIDECRSFGLNNHLPWNDPQELRHFKAVTCQQEPGEKQQNALIMGRNTFMGMGALPGRINIVISHYLKDSPTTSFVCVPSYEEAIQAAINAGCPRAFVIGGKKTLEYALMKAELRPTKVIMSVVNGTHAADKVLSKDALRDYECVNVTRPGAPAAYQRRDGEGASVTQPNAVAGYQVHTLVLKTLPHQ